MSRLHTCMLCEAVCGVTVEGDSVRGHPDDPFSQRPRWLAARQMSGNQLLMPVPAVDRTHFFLMLGANPLASNGSLMTAGGISRRLAGLRDRGGKLVVVDPRRTETAAIADRHLAIRPGTD